MTKDYFWALITLIIAIILAIVLLSITKDEGPGAAVKAECIDLELQGKIRQLALQGFDLAFIDRVQLLYDVWTKDPETAKAHPQRGQAGMQNAIHAYIYARELANKWSAPPCAPKPVGTD